MAGGKFSLANLFGITIRESANDGSDFTNPDADYRRLFLGEDAQLHVKDSAGAVTDIGGGLTDPMTTRGDVIVRNASNVTARLPIGSTGKVLQSDGTDVSWQTPSGGGVSWTQDVNETGTSFANFTASGGTWSSDGTEIIQTDVTATPRRAKYNTKIPSGFGLIYEAEIQFPTAGQGTGGNIEAALLLGFDGTNGNGLAIVLERALGRLQFDRDAVTNIRNVTTTINLDTWYKIRAAWASGYVSVYKDGTLLATTWFGPVDPNPTADFLGLYTYGAKVWFRNVNAWTLTGGAPA